MLPSISQPQEGSCRVPRSTRGSRLRKRCHYGASIDTRKQGRDQSSSHDDQLSCPAKTKASPRILNPKSAVSPPCFHQRRQVAHTVLRECNQEACGQWTPESHCRRNTLRDKAIHVAPAYLSSNTIAQDKPTEEKCALG
jgi:hypothetical protein